jgi:hypothetical protein
LRRTASIQDRGGTGQGNQEEGWRLWKVNYGISLETPHRLPAACLPPAPQVGKNSEFLSESEMFGSSSFHIRGVTLEAAALVDPATRKQSCRVKYTLRQDNFLQ